MRDGNQGRTRHISPSIRPPPALHGRAMGKSLARYPRQALCSTSLHDKRDCANTSVCRPCGFFFLRRAATSQGHISSLRRMTRAGKCTMVETSDSSWSSPQNRQSRNCWTMSCATPATPPALPIRTPALASYRAWPRFPLPRGCPGFVLRTEPRLGIVPTGSAGPCPDMLVSRDHRGVSYFVFLRRLVRLVVCWGESAHY